MFGLERFKSMRSNLMSAVAPPISIDFGAAGLKILQIGPGDPPELIAAACLPTPENLLGDAGKRLAFQIEQLPKLMKQGGFKGKRAVCSMPAGQTFCKHMQIAPVDGLSMTDLVRGSVAQQLGCNADALVCRVIDVGPAPAGQGRLEMIGLAASRATVSRLMDAVRTCRLEPVGMHPECQAVVKCFDHVTRRAGDEALVSLYLDMGLGCTRVIISNGTRPVFAKTIPLGGRFLDQAISKQANVDLAEARRIRMSLLNLCAAEPGRAQRPVLPAKAPMPAPVTLSNAVPGVETAVSAENAQEQRRAMALSPEIDRRNTVDVGAVALLASTTSSEARGAAEAGLTLPVDRRGPAVKRDIAAFDLAEYPPPPHGIDLREALDTLTDEIQMCLRYYEGLFPGKRVGRVIFVGGESRHVAFCQHVAKALKTPAHVADPMARLVRTKNEILTGVKFDEAQPGWAVPVGLCLLPTDL